MREFVFQIPHVHNVFPSLKLPLEVRLAKRWLIQLYTPELKLTHLEKGKCNELLLTADNRFIVKWGEWSWDFGFNLLGFGFGVSRKTDTMMFLDARHIRDIQERKREENIQQST